MIIMMIISAFITDVSLALLSVDEVHELPDLSSFNDDKLSSDTAESEEDGSADAAELAVLLAELNDRSS